MAEGGGGSRLGQVMAGVIVVFIIGLLIAPEVFSARIFRALNSLSAGATGWVDNPAVGMLIIVIALFYLFVQAVRR